MRQIGVIGAGSCDERIEKIAYEVGFEIGNRGFLLVCGGLFGVMEAACKGCKDAGGITLGILPTLDKSFANPYVDISIPTGMGDMRNFLIVRSSDGLIAISGGLGTLSEIAIAKKMGKPIVGIETFKNVEIFEASNAKEALDYLLSLL